MSDDTLRPNGPAGSNPAAGTGDSPGELDPTAGPEAAGGASETGDEARRVATPPDGSGAVAQAESLEGVILTPPNPVQPPPVIEQLPHAQYYLELQAWQQSLPTGATQVALPPHLAAGPRPEIEPANYRALQNDRDGLKLELARALADLRRLQRALAFWLPVQNDAMPAEMLDAIADDALLLMGLDSDYDEPDAFERGWVSVGARPDPQPAPAAGSPPWRDATLFDRLVVACSMRNDCDAEDAPYFANELLARLSTDPRSSAYRPQEGE